uniref:Class I histocompatibility antigen, F10 alpha chain-like n=1 Tax=Astyanax mexicanus TaxID=7994 RepID=W5KZ78_ASTMX
MNQKIMNYFIFIAFILQSSSAATHTLQYVYTAVTPGINFPEFTVVGQVDGEQIVYYDSKVQKMTPKTHWINKVANDDPDYWNRQTQGAQGAQVNFKINVAIAMQRFNHTKGVHTVQWMYGCELDDDGTKRGYDQFGYDGEDFMSVDLNTLTWTAPTPQAVKSKHKLDAQREAYSVKNYLENICIEWLKKYVGYGRSVLERKVPPEVSLFQKGSPSEVVCHATGFFPKAVMISWQKNGEELNEDVEPRETVPNQDGTFQKRSILTVSPEELKNNQYTCVVQHSSLEKELVRNFEPDGGMGGVIIGAVVAVLLLVLVAVGVVVWKKKKSGKNSGFEFVPVKPNGSTDGENSSTNS